MYATGELKSRTQGPFRPAGGRQDPPVPRKTVFLERTQGESRPVRIGAEEGDRVEVIEGLARRSRHATQSARIGKELPWRWPNLEIADFFR
jgi:hypothetical protein